MMKRILLTCLVLLAASGSGRSQTNEQALTFVAELRGDLVAPASVKTAATAKATGVLIGNRFTVHGSFSGLSSSLRDIEKKPDDPGVHLHRGAPGETTPYFHGLQVRLNADQRSGIFFGTATVDADQLKRLLANETYVDIHTVKNGPGEVRDQWRPLDKVAAAQLRASLDRQYASAQPLVSGSCH
jgi:CHRD domain